jgi:hypothetical protein
MTSTESAATRNTMNRIMKLLEVANNPSTPPAEAALAAERAERLMAKHMIDRMDLKPEEKSKIIQTEWFVNFSAADSYNSSSYAYHIVYLMTAVVEHGNLKKVPNFEYAVREDGTIDYETRKITILGYPEDIAYAERIWFNIFKAFVTNLNPQWQGQSFQLGENAYNFMQAGYTWHEIWHRAYAYKIRMQNNIGAEWDYMDVLTGKLIECPDPAKTKGMYGLRGAVKNYCQHAGIEYAGQTNRHNVYKASFAQSYRNTICRRMREIREEALRARDGEVIADRDRFALAVKDTKEQVEAEFYRLFPQYDPENIAKEEAAEKAKKLLLFMAMSPEEQAYVVAEEARRKAEAEAAKEKAMRNYKKIRTRSTAGDPTAWQRGVDVANKVNLRNDGEVDKNNQKELG